MLRFLAVIQKNRPPRMTRLPASWTEWIAFIVAAVVVVVLLLLWRPKFYPKYTYNWPWFQPTLDYHLKLVEWERDRVLTAAKGAASAAAAYLATLFTMVLKNEITAQVSMLSLIGTVVGALGLLVLAFDLSVATNRFAAKP